MKSKGWLFLLWFVFIFGPVVNSPLGGLGDLSFLSIALCLTWFVLTGRSFGKSLLPFCFLAFFLTFLAICNSILLASMIDSNSLRVIVRPLKALIIFFGLFYAVTYLLIPLTRKVGPRKTYETLLLIVYAVVVAHGVLIIAQFFYPPFRDLTYAVLLDSNVSQHNKWFRMPGLAGAGGAQVAAVQGLGFLVGVHLALIKGRYLPVIFCNILLMVTFSLTGRTGFVLVGVAALYCSTFVLLRMSQKLYVPRFKFKITGALLGVVVTVFITVVVVFMPSVYEGNRTFQYAVDRTFRTYNSYIETGNLSDDTIVALSKMVVFPQDLAVFSFGNARLYNNTLGAYQSDLGYIRLLWGYGILGLIGHVAFYLLMAYFILRPCVRKTMGIQNIVFGLWFLVAIFLLNSKEVFFFTRMSFPITIVVVMGQYWISRATDFSINTDVLVHKIKSRFSTRQSVGHKPLLGLGE